MLTAAGKKKAAEIQKVEMGRKKEGSEEGEKITRRHCRARDFSENREKAKDLTQRSQRTQR